MAYQVLARKWRPKNFSTLVGQEHIVRALSHALDQQRLHHAYLFTGTRGVGKTTLARILAKALNCDAGISSCPCGECSACIEIDSGRFIDLVEVDAATNTRVDEMRQLLENAVYAPTRGRFKVYVIDEVHMLSNSAFNAMLKTLEEPPEHIKFILATTDPQKIPVTVLSRCLQFNLKQISPLSISKHLTHILEAESVSFEPLALRHLSKAAAGSMRDALSLLDQAIAHGAGSLKEASVRDMLGTVAEDYLYQLLDALAARDIQAMLTVAESMRVCNLSFELALQDLAALFHRVALAQFAPDAIIEKIERDKLASYAAALDPETIQLYYQIVVHGRDDLALAPDEYIGFVMTLLRLVAFQPDMPTKLTHVVASPHQPVADNESIPAVSDWHSLLARLKLGGMVRELAHHCELVDQNIAGINLRLSHTHRHLLLNRGSQDKLQAELTSLLGRPIKLHIEVGQILGDTPAQRLEIAHTERHAVAASAIQQDTLVQNMVEQFDAILHESSIKPIVKPI